MKQREPWYKWKVEVNMWAYYALVFLVIGNFFFAIFSALTPG